MPQTVEAPVRNWRAAVTGNVLMMGLVSLFTDASSEMIYPLLPVFMNGLVGLGNVAVYLGVMEGVAETTASLLKIFSGRLSDAIGKRKSLVVIGYGISTICRPLMGIAGTGLQLIGLRFGDRVGKGIRTSPRDALIGESVSADVRGLAFGFHRAMDNTGAVIGPILAFILLATLAGRGMLWDRSATPSASDMGALRTVFLLAVVPGLITMAVLIGKVREIAPAPGKTTGKFTGRFEGWRQLPAKFYAFVGIVTLFALGNSSDLFLLLYGYTNFGFGLGTLLALWVALHLCKVVAGIPSGILSDKIGRRPLILAGWTIYALVYVGFAGAHEAWQFWVLFVSYGLFYGATEGVEKALVADFVQRDQYGTAFGVYHGVVGLAALPASVVFGVLWTQLGPQVAFGIGAALAAVAAALLIVLLSRKDKAPATSAA